MKYVANVVAAVFAGFALMRDAAGAASVIVALMIPAVASAQMGFFVRFIGAPTAIDCQSTDFTFIDGNLALNWNLPGYDLEGSEVGTAGGSVIFSFSGTLPATSGSMPITGSVPPYPVIAFPYTVSVVATPHAQGVLPASFSFVCPGVGPAINFAINNPNTEIPAASRAALAILGALLALGSAWVLRSRRPRTASRLAHS